MTAQLSTDRRPLRLLHTADVHVGDPVMGERRLDGLRRVIDAAIGLRTDALLIAGDLFDHARLSRDDFDPVLRQLARLRVPVVVTTGNHDALCPPSLYDRFDLREAGYHVCFLDDPDGSHVTLDELQLSFWARALVDHHPGHNPLAGFQRYDGDYWQVALAHGHFVPASQKPDRSSPLLEGEIAALDCDYLALGHWHRFLDLSACGTPASYPGSPSEAGGSYASVNLVTLQQGLLTRVERVPL